MPNHWDPMPNNNKKGFIRVTLNKSNIFPGSEFVAAVQTFLPYLTFAITLWCWSGGSGGGRWGGWMGRE